MTVILQEKVFSGAACRNAILSSTSVVHFFEKHLLTAINGCQTDLKTLRVAGDWRIYLELLTQKNVEVIYLAQPLNVHRRHGDSVTHTLSRRNHIDEVAYMHRLLASRLALPETHISRQKHYRAMLEQQFGLAPHNASEKALPLS